MLFDACQFPNPARSELVDVSLDERVACASLVAVEPAG